MVDGITLGLSRVDRVGQVQSIGEDCDRFQSLIKVILPLSGAGLVAVAAFTFLSS